MFQGLNMKVTVEMRDEVLNGYIGQWFANATKSVKDSKSNSSANGKELHIKEDSFESRNRKAFWSLIHPRKDSNGAWLPFHGPQSLMGICDVRWISKNISTGGFYCVKDSCGNIHWKWDSEKVFG